MKQAWIDCSAWGVTGRYLAGGMLVLALSACMTKPVSGTLLAETDRAQAQGCKPLKDTGSFTETSATIRDAGRYCLVQDLAQRRVYDIIEGRGDVGGVKGSAVIAFYKAKDADIDLQGHLVTTEPYQDQHGVTTGLGNTVNLPQGLLRLHNGTIRTAGSAAVGIRLQPYAVPALPYDNLYEGFREDDARAWHANDAKVDGRSELVPWHYPRSSRYQLEDLQVKSGGRGVIMVGPDSVLRNSVIEVDGKTAVYLYGPRPVVEGNTFIIHLAPGRNDALPAALKLRDAEGAVIRNNRFIVAAGLFATQRRAEVAINLLNSPGVLIEDNVIESTDQLVRKDAASSVMDNRNQLK